jgi:hypothetical protein
MRINKTEVKERWGHTTEYKESEEKTKDYTPSKWDNIQEEMNGIFKEFSECMSLSIECSDERVQMLVAKLHNFISENFYNCSKQILLSLANMYVCDNRFKEFIDKYKPRTTEYVLEAVKYYCR